LGPELSHLTQSSPRRHPSEPASAARRDDGWAREDHKQVTAWGARPAAVWSGENPSQERWKRSRWLKELGWGGAQTGLGEAGGGRYGGGSRRARLHGNKWGLGRQWREGGGCRFGKTWGGREKIERGNLDFSRKATYWR
jgi:hypothetical protein